ncbi:hypothetical protein BT67DRAFT_169700 [Trichocladium antarcticum]|uniref:Uncharacterized protein n=1 Tax=Trichocladium antarcticum TaxID=1450529 RepID=A0AAN6UE44_9PEZI|nr:hypothetical protein BT67DRAFT_169700 [Trichocladium antarcticum]
MRVRGGPSLTWWYAANSNMCDNNTQRNPLVVEHRWLTSFSSPPAQIHLGYRWRETGKETKTKMDGGGEGRKQLNHACIHPLPLSAVRNTRGLWQDRVYPLLSADGNQSSSQTGKQASPRTTHSNPDSHCENTTVLIDPQSLPFPSLFSRCVCWTLLVCFDVTGFPFE